MKALALKQTQDLTGKSRTADAAQNSVVAQRRSTFGPGIVTAPAIVDAGRPLDASTRTTMELGFGRDFSHIRVHDDARAHDNARTLNAQAYSAGDHVVFGEGRYRPETPGGRALIAHELAHNVQQGGVQMKADGPLSLEADAELERQADRVAFDVTAGRSAPTLSRIGRAAVFRAKDDPPAGGATATPKPGPQQKLPPGMVAITDDPPGVGTTELVVALTNFSLPIEKGIGPWVKTAYDEAAAGKRLVFSPLIEGNKVAAYKEGSEDYKSIWLGKFGFNSTQSLAVAFRSAAKGNDEVKTALADKGVASLINGMSRSLKDSGCDIDHIVEKQMGGTSIPSNLQLLLSKKNQESGRETYQALVRQVEAIRVPTMRGPRVRKLQLQLQAADVPKGTSDASFVVEDLLRRGAVKGSEAVKAAAEGSPLALTAGGVGETVRVRDTGKTPIDSMAKRIVPGMRILHYERGATGAKSKTDKVEAELDSRAIAKTGSKTSLVTLNAELAPAGAGAPKAADAAGSGAAAAPAPAAEETPASETRVLKLDKAKNKKIDFYYPYLSPGWLTSVALDDAGNLTGEGIIQPSVKFLGDLKVRYGPDLLEVVAPIPADKLRAPIPAFRFTGGEIGLTLFPEFVPKGTLNFEIGPKAKPVILGEITAKYEAGAFVAMGTLKPGMKLTGISEASGEVLYHSEKGWSGKLEAKSSSLPGATNVTAKLGFTSEEGAFHPYGEGGINTKIKDADLFLKVGWRGEALRYSGAVTVLKPLPLVEKVRLDGGYENELLTLSGDADIKWKSIAAKMHVVYRRKDGQEGKFSGKAGIEIKTEKALGHLDMEFNEAGDYWGKGDVSYQVTKDIRPKLGLELTKDHRVKVIGEVALADIPLTKKWPSPEGGKIEFIKGIGAKFSVPTPVPSVTAYGEIKVSAGLGYGVGPVMMKGIKFNGELFPLEDDPQIKARLTGKLAVPAYAELYGKFGAYIGVEVLLGAVGAKGGIDVKPTLGVKGEGGIGFDAQYDSGGFSFDATAYAKGSMYATLGVDLSAELYVAWGLWSHTLTYPVASVTKPLGPELNITFGKVGYSRTGELTWPNPSQFDINPKDLDPMQIIKELLSEGKTKDREEAKAKLKEMGFDAD